LGARTGDVVTRRTVPVPSWPENHLAQTAMAVAGMTVAVAVVCGYWTAGGSFGPSAAQPDPSSALQASRVAGGVTAAVGLLGLAGRWGRHPRLWVPATFTFIGSGAVAAFDGLTLLFFLMLPPETTEAGWSFTDTLLVIKVAIGVSAGVVGTLAVTAAAKNDKNPEGTRHLGPAPSGSSDLDPNQRLDTDVPTAAAAVRRTRRRRQHTWTRRGSVAFRLWTCREVDSDIEVTSTWRLEAVGKVTSCRLCGWERPPTAPINASRVSTPARVQFSPGADTAGMRGTPQGPEPALSSCCCSP
jgi:hypothetical protein